VARDLAYRLYTICERKGFENPVRDKGTPEPQAS
jgi:hypothetical protein